MRGAESLEISAVLSMVCTIDLRECDPARLRASIQAGFAGRLPDSERKHLSVVAQSIPALIHMDRSAWPGKEFFCRRRPLV